jgi:hypothetical protein
MSPHTIRLRHVVPATFAALALLGCGGDEAVGPGSATEAVAPRLADAVERAITRLRYGSVAVNTWSGLTFSFGTPPWGAYAGSTPQDIQSGTGFVHNTPMLERIEKTVLRHPLTVQPKPAFFPSHRTAHVVSRRLTALDAKASWRKVPGVVAAAMRG